MFRILIRNILLIRITNEKNMKYLYFIFEFIGFVIGFPVGLLLGFFIFIYSSEPADVKVMIIPLFNYFMFNAVPHSVLHV